MIEPKTQQDLVEQFLESIGETSVIYDEELDLTGIPQMHQLDVKGMMEQLDMIFRVRNGLMNVRWELHNPDKDYPWEKDVLTEKKIAYPNLVAIAKDSRKDKAEVLLKTFHTSERLVGVSWEIGADRLTGFFSPEDRDKDNMISRVWVSYDKLVY